MMPNNNIVLIYGTNYMGEQYRAKTGHTKKVVVAHAQNTRFKKLEHIGTYDAIIASSRHVPQTELKNMRRVLSKYKSLQSYRMYPVLVDTRYIV